MSDTFDTKITRLADAIRGKSGATGKLSFDGMVSAVNGIEIGGGEGDSSVRFGYYTDDGKFQAVDLSGDAPVDSGEPISVDAVMFKTGKPEPEYPGNGGGTGIVFYECASYTPDADAYIRYSFTLSGAPDELANGTYTQSEWVEDLPDAEDYVPIAKWINENGYSFIEEYGWGEFSYNIKNKSNSYIYSQEGPQLSRVTDYNSIAWVDGDTWEGVTLNFSAWQGEEMPATTEGWTGYKMNWVDASSPKPSNDIKAEFTYGGYVDYNGVFTLQDGNAVGGDRVWINTNPRGGEIKLNTTDSNVWEIILNGIVYARFATGNPDITVEDMCATPPDATILTQVVTPALPARWEKSDTLTTGLTVTHLKPQVGDIYSSDTTIRVRKMYDGAIYPIPSDGLVFYAPLQYDYVDMISGADAVITNGEFTEYNGLRCLKLDGSGYVKWSDNSDLPDGSGAVTMFIMIAPVNQNSWKAYLSIGAPSKGGRDLKLFNGRISDMGSAYSEVNKWNTIALVKHADSNEVSSYMNGKFDTTDSSNRDIPDTVCACVGACIHEGYTHKTDSYVAFAAVYNRELTAEEIAEIHNTLMEDVEQ